jgi:hypothetical protein
MLRVSIVYSELEIDKELPLKSGMRVFLPLDGAGNLGRKEEVSFGKKREIFI